MIKDWKKVPLPGTTSVVSITGVVKMTQSNQVFSPIFPKAVDNVVVGNKVEVVSPAV